MQEPHIEDYDLRRWRYPIIPVAFGAIGAHGFEFVPGQPRTYGVELTYPVFQNMGGQGLLPHQEAVIQQAQRLLDRIPR